ncbi:hypothetical protein AB0U42_23195, partial [Escherichia coli]
LNRLIRCVCGKKIGPDPRNFNQRVCLGRNDLLIRTFPNSRQAFADIAREAFANSVNIPPTLYKNQGEIITLIVGQDLDFSSIYKLKMVGTRR